MNKKCKHELNWDDVWIPGRLLKKTMEWIPLTKYWIGFCTKCGQLIMEYEIPYKK